MCCFSRSVEHVGGTKIFARSTGKGRQLVVYSMQIEAKEDLAMILPIPVPEKTAEDAVKFIDLEKYPELFNELERGFPVFKAEGGSFAGGAQRPVMKSIPLAVVEVGSFEASFVPTVSDFKRLDERFRLPDAAWESLPQYKTFGFAVFKLKPGKKLIHPMAFDFPVAENAKLFFPTVHIHDGKVHEMAEFDHSLYCQVGSDTRPVLHWRESDRPASEFVGLKGDRKLAAQIVNLEAHIYRLNIHGLQKNADTLV